MKRTTHRIPLDGVTSRVLVRYESDPAPEGTLQFKHEQFRILRELLDNPGLLDCGTQPFSKMRMSHNGECWVVELEGLST